MTPQASVGMTAAMMILHTPGAAALDYAALDLAVFPVAFNGRTPLTQHGCYGATTDPAEIVRLWSEHPSANVALATGTRSGVFALDLDRKNGVDGVAALESLQRLHGILPRSWRSRTPSGGQHVFFALPARALRNRVNIGGLGIDIRTTGGSVALPPSQKPSGAYVWLVDPLEAPPAEAPAWLLDFLDPPAAPRPPAKPLNVSRVDRAARYVAAALDGECGELAAMPPGSGRNQRLFQSAARLGELVGAGLLPRDLTEQALEEAADRCGLIAEDGLRAVAATIASGLARGLATPREVRP